MPNDDHDKFTADVHACVRELNKVLPGLARRYEELVVVAAMAEHIGGGLRILTQRGLCTEEQARQVLQQLKEAMALPESRES